MSTTSVNQVIQRAVSDAAFRRQLQHDPASTLAGFELTAEERAAITGGDPAKLTSLGVDQRMSKAFAIGGLSGSASAVIDSDTVGGLNAALIDENVAAGGRSVIEFDPGHEVGSRGIIGDPTSANAAVLDSTDASPGLNAFDEGSITLTTAAVDAGTGGPGLHAFDAGAPTGGTAVIDPLTASGNDWLVDPALSGGPANVVDADTGSSTASVDEPARDVGGDVDPTEY